MVADMAAEMEVHMVADMKVDKVANMSCSNLVTCRIGCRVGLFLPQAYHLACASSRLCEFIVFFGILWDPCPLEMLFSSVSLLFV